MPRTIYELESNGPPFLTDPGPVQSSTNSIGLILVIKQKLLSAES